MKIISLRIQVPASDDASARAVKTILTDHIRMLGTVEETSPDEVRQRRLIEHPEQMHFALADVKEGAETRAAKKAKTHV